MVFYKIEAVKLSDGSQKGLSRQEHRARANVIAEKSEGFFQKGDQRYLIFVVSILEEKVTIGCICKGKEKVDELLKKYAKLLPFEIESFKIEESAK